MKPSSPVVTGRRLVVEFSNVSVQEFERRRRAYHQSIQEAFFAAHRIAATEVHVVRRGETLWSIAQRHPTVPLWLLRQHNPDIDFSDLRPKTRLVLPMVEPILAQAAS